MRTSTMKKLVEEKKNVLCVRNCHMDDNQKERTLTSKTIRPAESPPIVISKKHLGRDMAALINRRIEKLILARITSREREGLSSDNQARVNRMSTLEMKTDHPSR